MALARGNPSFLGHDSLSPFVEAGAQSHLNSASVFITKPIHMGTGNAQLRRFIYIHASVCISVFVPIRFFIFCAFWLHFLSLGGVGGRLAGALSSMSSLPTPSPALFRIS